MQDTEKIRQQQELLLQAHEDADKASEIHQKEINELCNKINSLEVPENRFDDEQLANLMSILSSRLTHFVDSHFNDSEKLAGLPNKMFDGFPFTARHRRLLIHSYLAAVIYQEIFGKYFLGLDKRSSKVLDVIESYVDKACRSLFL